MAEAVTERLDPEFLEHVRWELSRVPGGEDTVGALMRKAGLSSEDEVTFWMALGLDVPARLTGISRNGTPPVEVMRRFLRVNADRSSKKFDDYMFSDLRLAAVGREAKKKLKKPSKKRGQPDNSGDDERNRLGLK